MTDKDILKLINDALELLQKDIEKMNKDFRAENFVKLPKYKQDFIYENLTQLLIRKETLLKLKTAIKRINKGDKSLNDYKEKSFIYYKYESAQD